MNKNNNIIAWEPALWGALFGSSAASTAGAIADSTITPDWFKTLLILTTASIAIASAYKTYQSTNNINKKLKQNTKQR